MWVTCFPPRISKALILHELGAMNGTVIWSSIEPCVGVTSACLPTLRPLALRLVSLASRTSRYVAAEREQKRFTLRARGYAHMGSTWPGFKTHNIPAEGPTTSISAAQGNRHPDHEDVMLDQIKVQKDVHLTSEIV